MSASGSALARAEQENQAAVPATLHAKLSSTMKPSWLSQASMSDFMRIRKPELARGAFHGATIDNSAAPAARKIELSMRSNDA